MKKQMGKPLVWSKAKKKAMVKVTQAKINKAIERIQRPRSAIVQEDTRLKPGLIVTGQKRGKFVVFNPARPDKFTNLVSVPKEKE